MAKGGFPFLDMEQKPKSEKREMARRVLAGTKCAAGFYPFVMSVLIHGTNETSMTVTLQHLKRVAPEWFRRT